MSLDILLGHFARFARVVDTIADTGDIAMQSAHLKEQTLVKLSDVLVQPPELAAHFVPFFGESFANNQHIPNETQRINSNDSENNPI